MSGDAIAISPGCYREALNRFPSNELPDEQYADDQTTFANSQTAGTGDELRELKNNSGEDPAAYAHEVDKAVRSRTMYGNPNRDRDHDQAILPSLVVLGFELLFAFTR